MGEQNDRSRSRRNWPKDYFGWAEIQQQFWWVLPVVAIAFLASSLLSVARYFKNRSAPTVIIYASQDQIYAEPVLRDFERQTAIRVRSVYDSEAVKTVGLAQRLMAERRKPRCDVFWGNEELRTRQLAAEGIFRETNGWAAFGYRSRRLAMPVTATNLPVPKSLLDLTNEIYRGRIVLAHPLFGTTATHFMALRLHWGERNWFNWCRALAANKPFVVDGNSVVVQFLRRGEAAIGLTDSDDIAAANREGANLIGLPMNSETLLIPSTVAVIRHCPHPEPAQRLFEYLQRQEVVERLVAAQALEGASVQDVNAPTLRPDWEALLRDIEPATEQLQQLFRR